MSWWLDISDLDDDQKNVIALPVTGDYLILGPPGSGKTNLLLIRAEYLIRNGQPNIFVLMFNESLHDFVVRGGSHYDLPPDKICKMLTWQIKLLRENGVSTKEFTGNEHDLDDKRKALAERVLKLLEENPRLEKHVECLFIDEVQDCLPEEIEVFCRCAKQVCFAGDHRQRIFSPQNVIDGLKKRFQTIELKTHYRIGHEICRVADSVGKTAGFAEIEETCNYKDGESKVHFKACADDDQQVEEIIKTLTIQLKAYPGELLAVVGPRKADRDFLRTKLEASPLRSSLLPHRQSGSDNHNQQIYLAHLTEIKGLEFRTIQLALMQFLSRLRENQKRIAFTAITRAKTTVSIYHTGSIPGYLEQARAAIEPPKPKTPLADLFPKHKVKK